MQAITPTCVVEFMKAINDMYSADKHKERSTAWTKYIDEQVKEVVDMDKECKDLQDALCKITIDLTYFNDSEMPDLTSDSSDDSSYCSDSCESDNDDSGDYEPPKSYKKAKTTTSRSKRFDREAWDSYINDEISKYKPIITNNSAIDLLISKIRAITISSVEVNDNSIIFRF